MRPARRCQRSGGTRSRATKRRSSSSRPTARPRSALARCALFRSRCAAPPGERTAERLRRTPRACARWPRRNGRAGRDQPHSRRQPHVATRTFPQRSLRPTCLTNASISPSGALTTCSGPGKPPGLHVRDEIPESRDALGLHRLAQPVQVAVLLRMPRKSNGLPPGSIALRFLISAAAFDCASIQRRSPGPLSEQRGQRPEARCRQRSGHPICRAVSPACDSATP